MEPDSCRWISVLQATPMTTPTVLDLQPGDTSCFWSSQRPSGRKSLAPKILFVGFFFRMSVSTVAKRDASRRVPQGRSSAPRLVRCMCNQMSAMAVAIAWFSCPFGVVDKNHEVGTAFKCTFCYDRQRQGLVPACAKACPTQSIRFGEIERTNQEAKLRVEQLQERGYSDAQHL